MTEAQPRGPVVFVGLYAAALVLTWVTLFSLERFGATEVRSWAPMIQAVLSAGAIFSAWWLQDLKRRADRAEAAADTVTSIVAISHVMESNSAHTASLGARGRLTPRMLEINRPGIDHVLDGFANANLAHLPSTEAARAYLGCSGQFRNMLVAMDVQKTSLGPTGTVDPKYMAKRYEQVFLARTAMLRHLGVDDPQERTAPEVIWAEVEAAKAK